MTWWSGAQSAVPRDFSATGNPDYDALPLSIRARYTLREWLWLSDHGKATLERTETEPEWDEP